MAQGNRVSPDQDLLHQHESPQMLSPTPPCDGDTCEVFPIPIRDRKGLPVRNPVMFWVNLDNRASAACWTA